MFFLLFFKKYSVQKLRNIAKFIVFTSISCNFFCFFCFFCFSGRLSIGNPLDWGVDKAICRFELVFLIKILVFLTKIQVFLIKIQGFLIKLLVFLIEISVFLIEILVFLIKILKNCSRANERDDQHWVSRAANSSASQWKVFQKSRKSIKNRKKYKKCL